ncbi:MAG: hypothetical protein ABIE42_11275 [Candidatus Eisenbacteria bacterium]
MAITTTIDSDTGARTHVVTGELVPEDLLHALGQIYGRSDYRPGACVLWDLRGTELHLFAKRDIRLVADFITENRNAPPGTCAALVVARDLDFGLARMLEQMLVAATDVRITVFRDIDEAKAWLGRTTEVE